MLNHKLAVIGAVLTVFLTAGVTYAVAGIQEARAQRGVEADQDSHDRGNSSPLKIDLVRDNGSVVKVFSKALSLGEVESLPGLQVQLEGQGVFRVNRLEQDASTDPYSTVKTIELTLRGTNYAPVLINEMRVRLTSRSAPAAGTLIYRGTEGASDVEQVAFDLDSPDTRAREIGYTEPSGQKQVGKRFFEKRKITLTKDESVPFAISAVTRSCACEYVVDVEFADGQVQTLDDGGKPWRTTALARAYQAVYKYDTERDGPFTCVWPTECLFGD